MSDNAHQSRGSRDENAPGTAAEPTCHGLAVVPAGRRTAATCTLLSLIVPRPGWQHRPIGRRPASIRPGGTGFGLHKQLPGWARAMGRLIVPARRHRDQRPLKERNDLGANDLRTPDLPDSGVACAAVGAISLRGLADHSA